MNSLEMIQVAIFLLSTLGFILLSRQAFRDQSSHGFPRFFAFEAILGLVVLNAPFWFSEPFSLPQLISWILLLVSGILVVAAILNLRRFGKHDASIHDPNRISIERTTQLVMNGPYRYIRHPMYASLIFLAWGIFFKNVSLLTALLVLITTLALFLAAINEERENIRIFGDRYINYMKSTRRFIPFIY